MIFFLISSDVWKGPLWNSTVFHGIVYYQSITKLFLKHYEIALNKLYKGNNLYWHKFSFSSVSQSSPRVVNHLLSAFFKKVLYVAWKKLFEYLTCIYLKKHQQTLSLHNMWSEVLIQTLCVDIATFTGLIIQLNYSLFFFNIQFLFLFFIFIWNINLIANTNFIFC